MCRAVLASTVNATYSCEVELNIPVITILITTITLIKILYITIIAHSLEC